MTEKMSSEEEEYVTAYLARTLAYTVSAFKWMIEEQGMTKRDAVALCSTLTQAVGKVAIKRYSANMDQIAMWCGFENQADANASVDAAPTDLLLEVLDGIDYNTKFREENK